MDEFPPSIPAETPGNPARHLWTPWRMRYVGGGDREPGCIFCNRLAGTDDAASLIVHRDDAVFAIMNLYPYSTAHLMIVPNDHVPSPEAASGTALARMGTLLGPVMRALRRVLGCQGFNVGLNVGAVSGAGVAEHLHQHVVPRWTGDANFMPILAGTTVMPELLPVTYAKVRAEIQRELSPADRPDRDIVRVLVTAEPGTVVLEGTPDAARLPRFTAAGDGPLWRAAVDGAARTATEPEITGWAGDAISGRSRPAILAVRARGFAAMPKPMFATGLPDAARLLNDPDDREALARVVATAS